MEIKYAGLKAEMARRGDTNKTIADLLKLSEPTISRRLSRWDRLVSWRSWSVM